mgnify:CR=1 FL=1
MIRHVVYECLPGVFAGGVQKMVFELASAQRRTGADVEVWTVDAPRAGSAEVFDGLTIRYFPPDPAWGYVRSRALIRELETSPPASILHAHSTFHPLNHDVAVAARRLGRKLFFHPHGALDPALFGGWSLKSLKKRLYLRLIGIPDLDRSAGAFALTPLEARQLASLGVRCPVIVLPNGIAPLAPASSADAARFRSEHRIPSSARVILFVGRIMPKKRLEDIVAAFARLRRGRPDLFLVVAGDPAQDVAYHRSLVAEADRLGCADALRWTGFLDERAKPAAFAAADCFVHASVSEGMALAILEALAAGLPVVATRGCYMRAAAAAEALLECEQGPDALAAALGQVLADDGLARRLRENARAHARAEHDWDALAVRCLAAYDSPRP